MAELRTTRDVPPCKGCPDRYTACYDHCQKPEFLQWKKNREIIRQNRQKDRSVDSYQADQIRKNRRVR